TVAELIDPYLRSFIHQSTGTETNHILDKTGLAGKYDFTLKFDARPVDSTIIGAPGIRAGETSSAGSASDPSGLPGPFIALERQLGLKLIKVKGFQLDTIVIDHIEPTPTEN